MQRTLRATKWISPDPEAIMDLDFACLASFLVLYDEQHYGRAAAQLRLTPSALTKRIRRLERQVGVELMTRCQGASAEPTAAGHRFRTAGVQLLEDAEAARRTALAAPEPGRGVLVLGIPPGPQRLFRDMLPGVMTEVRANWPGARLICRAVPFPALTSALLGHQIDVLWAPAEVHHPAVSSAPLGFPCARIGVVNLGHELAGTDAVDATDFAALPMLYNPAVPDELMSVFYLGDIRPRGEAHLVRGRSDTMAGVTDHDASVYLSAYHGRHPQSVVVVLELFEELLGPRLHPLRLDGVPPIGFHAAWRRRERRGPVLSLVDALGRAAPY